MSRTIANAQAGDVVLWQSLGSGAWTYALFEFNSATGALSLNPDKTTAIAGFATSTQGGKADSALQNAAAFATAAQGALAASALQSQAGLILTADSGWTANSTAGDKTASLSSYSNGLNSTIIAALNLAAANSGTALGAALDVLVVVVKKLAALETAFVASKIPNA